MKPWHTCRFSKILCKNAGVWTCSSRFLSFTKRTLTEGTATAKSRLKNNRLQPNTQHSTPRLDNWQPNSSGSICWMIFKHDAKNCERLLIYWVIYNQKRHQHVTTCHNKWQTPTAHPIHSWGSVPCPSLLQLRNWMVPRCCVRWRPTLRPPPGQSKVRL